MSTPPTVPEIKDENYIQHTLRTQKALPPFRWNIWYKEIDWIGFSVLFVPPVLAIYGACTTELKLKTFLLAFVYYFLTAIGITAGYHRLWAHRSYNASLPLQYFLASVGAAAIQGPIKSWARGHRAHHRYTDTDLDPYNAHKGLLYSHVGWMLITPRRKPGTADVSDLSKDTVVRWQYNHYGKLILGVSVCIPTLVCGLGWRDWRGGFVYAVLCRLVVVHHSTFCVNSVAHYLGESPFDDKHTPRDHFLTAILTLGEGYHNFHHQFPMDYRNAIKFYQYDPTKWFIRTMAVLGLASHLKTFSKNEVRKGQLTMELKRLRELQGEVKWPGEENELPVIGWKEYVEKSRSRPLVVIAGFIHDLSDFMDDHPGGRPILNRYIGRDATTAFFGGVYEHSNAGHNLLAMKRVAILQNGMAHGTEENRRNMIVPPASRMRVVKWDETFNSAISSSNRFVFKPARDRMDSGKDGFDSGYGSALSGDEGALSAEEM